MRRDGDSRSAQPREPDDGGREFRRRYHEDRGAHLRREDVEDGARPADERVLQQPPELEAQDEVGEAPQRRGMCVVEWRVHRGPDRNVRVQNDREDGDDPGAGQHEARPPREQAGLDRQQQQQDARGQQDGQRVVAQRDRVHGRRRQEQPVRGRVGRPLPPRVGLPDALRPGDQQEEQERREEEVERVRVGPLRRPPGDRCAGQQQAGGDSRDGPPGQPLHRGGDEAPGSGHQDRGEQVDPEGRVAERGQDDAGGPREQHVRRKPRGMRDPQDRPDGLELGRVPEPDGRHECREVQREGDHEGADGTHHPSTTPQ